MPSEDGEGEGGQAYELVQAGTNTGITIKIFPFSVLAPLLTLVGDCNDRVHC